MRTLIDSDEKRDNHLCDHSRLENRHSFVWNVLRVKSFVWLFEENTKTTNTKPNLTACDRTVSCNIFKNCVCDI